MNIYILALGRARTVFVPLAKNSFVQFACTGGPGCFPDGNSTLILVCTRLRNVAGTREKILTIKGNTPDGYDIFVKDGRIIHCRMKLEIRKCLAQDT